MSHNLTTLFKNLQPTSKSCRQKSSENAKHKNKTRHAQRTNSAHLHSLAITNMPHPHSTTAGNTDEPYLYLPRRECFVAPAWPVTAAANARRGLHHQGANFPGRSESSTQTNARAASLGAKRYVYEKKKRKPRRSIAIKTGTPTPHFLFSLA